MKCSRCQTNMHKNGTRDGLQRFKCGSCGYEKQERKKSLSSGVSPVITEKGNVLIISDLHLPFEHRNALSFVCRVRDKYKCDVVIGIGDFFDMHALSYHEHDPDGYSLGDELDEATSKAQMWIKEFPKVYQIDGNHSSLPFRKAKSHGFSKRLMKTYNEIFDLPDTWYWSEWYEKDGVRYQHGCGKSGKYMHLNWAVDNMQPTVTGHGHSNAGVDYKATNKQLVYGMGVGCLIDRHSYSMEYGKNFGNKPILSCGVVLDDGKLPILETMEF